VFLNPNLRASEIFEPHGQAALAPRAVARMARHNDSPQAEPLLAAYEDFRSVRHLCCPVISLSTSTLLMRCQSPFDPCALAVKPPSGVRFRTSAERVRQTPRFISRKPTTRKPTTLLGRADEVIE
jgi:hypothetical protein